MLFEYGTLIITSASFSEILEISLKTNSSLGTRSIEDIVNIVDIAPVLVDVAYQPLLMKLLEELLDTYTHLRISKQT